MKWASFRGGSAIARGVLPHTVVFDGPGEGRWQLKWALTRESELDAILSRIGA